MTTTDDSEQAHTVARHAWFVCAFMLVCMVLFAAASMPVAGETATLSASTADDVVIDTDGRSTQTVEFNVTPDDASATERVTLSPSKLPPPAIQQAHSTVRGTQHVGVEETTVSDGRISIELSGTDHSPTTAVTVTTTITYNTATLTAADAVSEAVYTLTSADSTTSTTAEFDVRYRTADAARVAGSRTVLNGTTAYQGEDDLRFVDTDGRRIDVTAFEKTAGQAEGTTLSLPIAEDEPPGTYEDAASGMRITVQEPRITTAEVQRDGSTIDQIPADNAVGLTILAEWNFDDAEQVAVTVEDPSGRDVTDQVVSAQTVATSGDRLNFSLVNEEPGTYTVSFEGNTNLDGERVTETYTIETTDADGLTVEPGSENSTQGDALEYTLAGGLDGDRHLVVIDASQLRNNRNKTALTGTFRDVGETTAVGLWNATAGQSVGPGDSYNQTDIAYAYAIVEMDGTEARGEIATQNLADTSVDIAVYTAISDETYDGPQQLSELVPFRQDTDDVAIREGTVTLDAPTGAYTIGQPIDVHGTASGAEAVGLYVHDADGWKPVGVDSSDHGGSQVLSVDSDKSFNVSDVVLSDADAHTLAGGRILSFPGQYELAVVDMADVENTTTVLSTTELREATHETYPLAVSEGNLTATFETVGGQVAATDARLDITGTAVGQDRVAYAVVGSRGNTVAGVASVNQSAGTFTAEDIGIRSLTQGEVTGYVVSLGRDGVPGASTTGPIHGSDAEAVADYINSRTGSGTQVRSQITAATVNATGSDDQVVTETFRYDDTNLSILNVYPADAKAEGIYPVAIDETVVIEAQTTRRADTAAISVEVLTSDGKTLVSSLTDQWGADGRITTRFPANEIGLGPFIVRVHHHDTAVREEIQIVTKRDTRLGYRAENPNVTLVENPRGEDNLRVNITHGGMESIAVGGITPETAAVERVSGDGEVQSSGAIWSNPENATVSLTLTPPDTLSRNDTIKFNVVDIRANQRIPVTLRIVEKRVTESTASAESGAAGATTSTDPTDPTRNTTAQTTPTGESTDTVERPPSNTGSATTAPNGTTTTENSHGFGVLTVFSALIVGGLLVVSRRFM